MQGELPAGLAERWSVEKRFARLTVQGAFLVLELDVIVAGGVSENYLLATTELWDRLLQEFLLFLRANAAPGAGEEAGQSQESLSEAQAESAAEPTTQGPRGAPGRRPRSRIRSVSAARRERCQLVRQTMNSILKQPTKVRIAAAVLLVAGAAGAVALMRGSPAQSSESKPAPQAAAKPAAAAAPPPAPSRRPWPRWARCRWIGTSCSASCRRCRRARAAQGQSRGPGSMAARPARRGP